MQHEYKNLCMERKAITTTTKKKIKQIHFAVHAERQNRQEQR